MNQKRILVLGSNISGAFNLKEVLQSFLEEKDKFEPQINVVRDVAQIEAAILGRQTIEEGGQSHCLPVLVILLWEMRQYPEGRGMTIDVDGGVDDYVDGLCQRYDIPLIKIKKGEQGQIGEKLKELTMPI